MTSSYGNTDGWKVRTSYSVLTMVDPCAPANLGKEGKRTGALLTQAFMKAHSQYRGTFPRNCTMDSDTRTMVNDNMVR